MSRSRLLLMPLWLALAGAALGQKILLAQEAAQQPADNWEAAAKKLQQATLTVRILTARPADPAASDAREPSQSVTVCSGVCVREGQIVTAAMAGSDSQIRLTMAGGQQAEAKLQVIDEFSGLALLKCDAKPAVPLELAAGAPAVGGSVMTASGWGVELPLVSLGIVAGTERKTSGTLPPGAHYPPLIQCDLRTTDTSSGAGVVDRHGRLLGIIVAADSPESRRGWAYAVPVSHVERLLRTAEAQKQAGVTIIKRRRPVVGWQLEQQEEAIVVTRVFAGGGAESAGVKVGDEVLTAEGIVIRSIYQASQPTLYKQPGDTIAYRLRRASGVEDVKIVLGGGVEVSSAPLELLSGVIQPKIQIVREGAGFVTRRPGEAVREVFQPPLPAEEPAQPAATPAEKIALLEKALDRYRAVIEYQQRQLSAEQKRRTEHEALLKSLQSELDTLRRQLQK